MPLEPPLATRSGPPSVDLLIVGALTIDRFEDGSTAAGGSVLHAARATAAAGYRPAVVTVAGDEPEAAAALAELAGYGLVHCEHAQATLRFRHRETAAGRELVLAGPAPALACPPLALSPAAVLYAPVASEIGPSLGGQHYDGALRAAILQGWLRRLEPGARVDPLPLTALTQMDVALRAFDLIVASSEDLRAAASNPSAQLDALRARCGPHPCLVVTDGPAGSSVDRAGTRTQVLPPAVVKAQATVGAGDAFAAIMATELGRGADALDAARLATLATVRLLAARTS